jgi:hypothetical protein
MRAYDWTAAKERAPQKPASSRRLARKRAQEKTFLAPTAANTRLVREGLEISIVLLGRSKQEGLEPVQWFLWHNLLGTEISIDICDGSRPLSWIADG